MVRSPFVFPVFIVHHHQDAADADLLDSFRNPTKAYFHCIQRGNYVDKRITAETQRRRGRQSKKGNAWMRGGALPGCRERGGGSRARRNCKMWSGSASSCEKAALCQAKTQRRKVSGPTTDSGGEENDLEPSSLRAS